MKPTKEYMDIPYTRHTFRRFYPMECPKRDTLQVWDNATGYKRVPKASAVLWHDVEYIEKDGSEKRLHRDQMLVGIDPIDIRAAYSLTQKQSEKLAAFFMDTLSIRD